MQLARPLDLEEAVSMDTARWKGPSWAVAYSPGVPRGEQIDRRGVAPFQERNLQLPHEPADRHPEVIADQQQGLDPAAVALAEGLDQNFAGLGRVRVEPQLELVD